MRGGILFRSVLIFFHRQCCRHLVVKSIPCCDKAACLHWLVTASANCFPIHIRICLDASFVFESCFACTILMKCYPQRMCNSED